MATNTYVALDTQTLSSSATSVTFSSIPQGYTDLVLVCSVRVTSATDDFNIQFNGENTGTNYSFTQLTGTGSAASSGRASNSNQFRLADYMPNSTLYGTIISHIQNYSNTTTYKTVLSRWGAADNATGANVGTWRNTAAITSIRLAEGSNLNLIAGSTFTLYGIAAQPAWAAKATGGTITNDVQYTYHTFTSSGTFTPSQTLTADYLVVAGGGGGSDGGPGGAGGLRSTVTATGGGGSLESALALTAQGYTVTVGSGGANGTTTTNGTKGSDSVFGAITSAGGGAGKEFISTATSNQNGGSGAGGINSANSGLYIDGGTGTANQGYAGGRGYRTNGGYNAAGGGGGAGGIGIDGAGTGSAPIGGNGGPGVAVAISGSSVTYAGGGGGGAEPGGSPVAGSGGSGGGGAGSATTTGGSGTTNTGGGGGGGETNGDPGGSGGSGIVIIRYAN
jgi:hypothetical protein